MLNGIDTWDKTPPGRQILTIFHTDALVPDSFEILMPTMALIKEYRHTSGQPFSDFHAGQGALFFLQVRNSFFVTTNLK